MIRTRAQSPQSRVNQPRLYESSGRSSSELYLPTKFDTPAVSGSKSRRHTSQLPELNSPESSPIFHPAGQHGIQYPHPSPTTSYGHIIERLTQQLDITRRERDEYAATVAYQANQLRILKSTISQLRQEISSTRSSPTSLRSPKSTLFNIRRKIGTHFRPSTPFGGNEPVPSDFTTNPADDAPFLHRVMQGPADPMSSNKPISPGTDPSLFSSSDGWDTLSDTASLFASSTHSEPATIYSRDRGAKSHEDLLSKPDWSAEFNDKIQPTVKISLAKIISHDKAILCVKFSPDGNYLAAGCANGTAYIYDVLTWVKKSSLADRSTEDVSIKIVCFDFDNRLLATAGSDHLIRIWIIANKYNRNVFKGHEGAINAMDFSSNGKFVVSSSDDKTVRIWRIRDGSSRVLTAGHGIWSSHLSSDGRYVACGCNPRSLLIWDVRTGRLVHKWNGHKDPIDGVEFTPDRKGLVTASWDKKLKRWDISYLAGRLGPEEFARMQRDIRQNGGKLGKKKVMTLNGHTNYVSDISISHDGRWVASSSWDDTVRIWNLRNATTECECTLHGHKDVVWSVDFSPVGGYLATGGGDHKLTVWDYA